MVKSGANNSFSNYIGYKKLVHFLSVGNTVVCTITFKSLQHLPNKIHPTGLGQMRISVEKMNAL